MRLKQFEFWGALGVTQSGGSRYESGREIPEPVQILLNLALGGDMQSAELFGQLRKIEAREREVVAAKKAKPKVPLGFGMLP
ncbi:hypothetical protein C666_03550 [Thauera linaloolentis 47Lol = DSM 12138]|uniref:RsaL-like HTH domain-containing protein n=2 Tax=Thauera linaloolentis TaxID=76112 RepID=N6ZCP4_THAL4|nr:hypothetical protein [Thauera linaloolentis]ENO89929.1 hypothetical protein C666_03550 [Thauera linaloolentis 47Lol = DSM 12138]MCM8566644.1 hypothetical protein [Thauera linaloolentis]